MITFIVEVPFESEKDEYRYKRFSWYVLPGEGHFFPPVHEYMAVLSVHHDIHHNETKPHILLKCDWLHPDETAHLTEANGWCSNVPDALDYREQESEEK